jgi:putative endonuclease
MTRGENVDPGRLAAYRRGLFGEALALWSYRCRLYRLLARRYKTPAGEIDLIVKRGRAIVFAEVKHRPTETGGLEAITSTARRRITRAAELWLAAHPDAEGFDLRFDLVIVRPFHLPRHIRSVFDADGRS